MLLKWLEYILTGQVEGNPWALYSMVVVKPQCQLVNGPIPTVETEIKDNNLLKLVSPAVERTIILVKQCKLGDCLDVKADDRGTALKVGVDTIKVNYGSVLPLYGLTLKDSHTLAITKPYWAFDLITETGDEFIFVGYKQHLIVNTITPWEPTTFNWNITRNVGNLIPRDVLREIVDNVWNLEHHALERSDILENEQTELPEEASPLASGFKLQL